MNLSRPQGLALWWVRRLNRPLTRIGERSRAIAEGDESQGIEVESSLTEIRDLAADLERMRTQLARQQADLEHIALHDPLTGLGNRMLFEDRLEQAVADAARGGDHGALALLDLDDFKQINDTFGHQAGDAVLAQAADRLAAVVQRRTDTLARLGGDEFAVLLRHATVPGAEAVLREITSVMGEPFEVEGRRLRVGLSAGIAVYPGHTSDAGDLLRRADVAMYTAKRAGDTWAVYASDADPHSVDHLELAEDLRSAIETGEGLSLSFQPKVDLASEAVYGYEALARWEHPGRGQISPARFIPLAARISMMRSLSRQIARMAFKALADPEGGLRVHGFEVSLNLAASDLADPGLADCLLALASEHGVDPRRVTLEITEREALTEAGIASENLARLRSAGFRVALDDFGTGYASLEQLQSLPVDEVKIDTQFTRGIATNRAEHGMVAGIVLIAHSLGVRVVAEGVESPEVLRVLHALNANAAQGFLFDQARPLAELLETGMLLPRPPTVAAAFDEARAASALPLY